MNENFIPPCTTKHGPFTASEAGARSRQVVLAPPDHHWQTFQGPVEDLSLTGGVRAPISGLPQLGMGPRRVIAHRAMLEITNPNAIINLGVGMPEVRNRE